MILLDVTIVNVALPSIQHELGVSPSNLEWVVGAYTLVLAALILVGGSLGDRVGRRREALIGLRRRQAVRAPTVADSIAGQAD